MLTQPRTGYRAGTDAVLLAAAVPAQAGHSVLELGCGAGGAILCLMRRVPGLMAAGVEKQDRYAQLARQNAATNGLDLEVIEAMLEDLPKSLTARSFDHVLANPPFFDPGAVSSPADPGKSIAHEQDPQILPLWVGAARKRLKPSGTLTLIHRTEALPALLGLVSEGFGDVEVLPIASRKDRNAERILMRAKKGRRGPMRLLAPLIMHDGDSHLYDGNDYSDRAKAVLKDGAALQT